MPKSYANASVAFTLKADFYDLEREIKKGNRVIFQLP